MYIHSVQAYFQRENIMEFEINIIPRVCAYRFMELFALAYSHTKKNLEYFTQLW